MGFLDRFFGRKGGQIDKEERKRTRGPSRSADERLKAEQARFIRELRVSNPTLYQQYMARQIGMAMEGPPDKLEEFVRTMRQLKEAGVLPRGKGEIGETSWIKEGAEVIKLAFEAYMAQSQQRTPVLPPGPPPSSPPQPTADAQQSHRGIPEGASPTQPTPQEGEVSIVSSWLISQLRSKTPEQAADWFIRSAAQYPQASGLVDKLRSTPDDQLLVLLDQLGASQPDAAGFVNWLRSNPAWLMDTVKAIRARTSPGAPGGAMAI